MINFMLRLFFMINTISKPQLNNILSYYIRNGVGMILLIYVLKKIPEKFFQYF